MSKFYVHCNIHGETSPYFDTKEEAAKYRRDYLKNNPDCNPRVIHEHSITKYGKTISNLRLAK